VALDHRDRSSQGDAQGEIDVRRLTRVGADGCAHTSWIVDLPGTKAWQLDPCHRDYLNDLATNLATMAGAPSARVDGVTRALTLAGVGPDEPVMLVGHSQGGLVAMRAAEEYARTGAFAVTHVVTAGAPIARMPVPPSVSVLALENRSDLVPRLDGQPPPPEPNRVTALFEVQHNDLGRNHSLTDAYLAGGRWVDGDVADPSLAAWRRGAAAFLPPAGDQVHVSTTVWDIRNGG
jgi:alpha-beta hydrolase superfamily lysophospholipase